MHFDVVACGAMGPNSDRSPTVTLCVTCFNQAQWVRETLDSVEASIDHPAQVIITDDASTDGSRDEIERWLAEHPDFDAQFFAADTNRGLAATLNHVSPLFRGDFIAVINADDWMEPRRLAMQAAALDAAPSSVGLVYCDLREIDDAGAPTGRTISGGAVAPDPTATLLRVIADHFVSMPMVMFRRTLLEAIGPWDESIASDDFDFMIRSAASGYLFSHVPEILVNYRRHEGQLSGNSRLIDTTHGRIRSLRKVIGRSQDIDAAAYARMEGFVAYLHSVDADRQENRRNLRFLVRRRPTRRLVRATIENQLHMRPGALSRRAVFGTRPRPTSA